MSHNQNPVLKWSTQNRASRIKKAAATISGWDCPLLTFIYPGFEQVAQMEWDRTNMKAPGLGGAWQKIAKKPYGEGPKAQSFRGRVPENPLLLAGFGPSNQNRCCEHHEGRGCCSTTKGSTFFFGFRQKQKDPFRWHLFITFLLHLGTKVRCKGWKVGFFPTQRHVPCL